MPPKPAASKPSKKTELKKKEKTIEDKTFGLKNKKGAKQQKFIQQVEKQVKSGGQPARKIDDKDKKKAEDDPLAFDAIFKPVVQSQKVEKGADPKSVLCAFFKQGQCKKGDKCKFSHDLAIERKAEKRSLYCDVRDDEAAADTMDQWDEAKLQEVVEKKHGASDRSKPKTDIICKFFLDAVEKSKYGWFWECPNGGDCHYRHALPSGFVLKRDKLKEKKDEISLEDLIERERNALGSNLTRVTLESFVSWKKRKVLEKKQALLKDEEKKRTDFKAGRQVGLSGREMFTFNPLMAEDQFEDGDEAFDTAHLPDDDEDGERDTTEYREIQFDDWENDASEVDDSGTQATTDRFSQLQLNPTDITSGLGPSQKAQITSLPIDESLFDEDDDELEDSDVD